MPKSIEKYEKRTSSSSSPYKKSPSLPVSLLGELSKMKIKDENPKKAALSTSSVPNKGMLLQSKTEMEKHKKIERKPMKFWSKEEELELLGAMFDLCHANVVSLRDHMTEIDRNCDQIHKKLNSFQNRFVKQCNGNIRH